MKPALRPALLCLMLANVAIPSSAQEVCLKEVFNRYCLGGPISPLVEKTPQEPTLVNGAEMYMFKDGSELTVVSTFGGLVEYVMRQYQPGTMLTFARMRGRLVDLYGKPVRNAFLPSYATSTSDIETAIAIGKGRVRDRWQHDGWRIDLIWTNSKEISLFYTHDETAKKRRAANPNPDGF